MEKNIDKIKTKIDNFIEKKFKLKIKKKIKYENIKIFDNRKMEKEIKRRIKFKTWILKINK